MKTRDAPAYGPLIEQLKERFSSSFAAVLQERLVALVAYGSSVEGSFVPGFSDFDLAIFLRGAFSTEDAIAVRAGLGDLDASPFDYLQIKFVDCELLPAPALVPGSFSVFWGKLPTDPVYLHTVDTLRASGASWLRALPDLIADDRSAWTVAVDSERRQRLVRLALTRLKPALRSHLVELGEAPFEVWVAGWPELALRLHAHDPPGAEMLDEIIARLPPVGAEAESDCGDAALRLLTALASVYPTLPQSSERTGSG